MKILRSELAYVITALRYKSIGIKTNLNKWLRTFADNLVSIFALLMCGPSAASRWWAGRNCSAWLHSLQLHAWGALLLTHPASFVLLCVTWGSSEGASRNNRITFYIRFHPDLLHRDNNLMPHSWVSISLPIQVENKQKIFSCGCQAFFGILLTSWYGWLALEMSSG